MADCTYHLRAIAGNGQAILIWETKSGEFSDEYRTAAFRGAADGGLGDLVCEITSGKGAVTVPNLTNGQPCAFLIRTYTPEYEWPSISSNAVPVIPRAQTGPSLTDREDVATVLLAALLSMQAEDPWVFADLRQDDAQRAIWIETTSTIDLRDLADHIIAAIK